MTRKGGALKLKTINTRSRLDRLIEKNELVDGVTTTGLMGWIDPRRLNLPNTGDMSSGAWPFVMFAGIAGCAALLLLKRKEAVSGSKI